MVNLRSGKRLWRPPDSDWDYEWDIELIPNPEGTWYRVPGSRRWVHLDSITSWIHRTTEQHWYLVEDAARPLSARPPLPHQIEFILAKLTLRRMTTNKGGSVAPPVTSGRYLSPNPPHPMSYVGALLSPRGGDCEPSSTVLQSTPAPTSAAIELHQMARRRKRPRRRHGRRNVPRAPNPPDEATPSHHPQLTMGGTSTPTTTLMSTRANDQDPRLHLSPSLQPFTIEGTTSTYSGGGFNDSFRDIGVILPPRKCPRQKYRPRRVCRRHSPRAPNSQESRHGRGHRPRAPNISPEAA